MQNFTFTFNCVGSGGFTTWNSANNQSLTYKPYLWKVAQWFPFRSLTWKVLWRCGRHHHRLSQGLFLSPLVKISIASGFYPLTSNLITVSEITPITHCSENMSYWIKSPVRYPENKRPLLWRHVVLKICSLLLDILASDDFCCHCILNKYVVNKVKWSQFGQVRV